MTTRVIVAVAFVAAAILIWAMISPLMGARLGQLNDPASAGAPR
jgi:hypothetical protein